jgi:hypothetical protein
MPEAEPDPLTRSTPLRGGVLYALGPSIVSTNQNHGKGGCGAIELALLSGDILTADHYRVRAARGVLEATADAGGEAAGGVGLAASDAGEAAAGGVVFAAGDACVLAASGVGKAAADAGSLIRNEISLPSNETAKGYSPLRMWRD